MKNLEAFEINHNPATHTLRLPEAIAKTIAPLVAIVTAILPVKDMEPNREIPDEIRSGGPDPLNGNDKTYKPSPPWSITRQTKPLQGLSRQDWVEYFSLHSVGFKGRVTGGNQIATASDISRYAEELSRFGHGEEAQKYSKLAGRLSMLGRYNYAQGVRFSNLTQAGDSVDYLEAPRKLSNRSMRRHLGLQKP